MVNIKRILCPVDLSQFSRDALHHALALARWYEAQITVFHVYSDPQPVVPVTGMPGNVPLPPPAQPGEVTEEVRRFCAPSLRQSGQSVDIVVSEGNPTKEIVKLGEQLPADLLVLGTHGRSGFERLFLGSVTEKVLRSTRVPAMTVPPPVTQPGPALYKTILCPLEFSDASTRALDYALSLAQEANARLILLHVIESLLGEAGAAEMGHLTVAEYDRYLEEDAIARLKSAVPDPAEPSTAAGVRAPYLADFIAVKTVVTKEALEALFRPARYAMIELAGLPETHAVERAAMPRASVKYPVLLFSHGLGNPTVLYTAALEDLASHGYVVAAIEHTYDSAFTVFPGGRVVTYARDAWSAATQKAGGYVDYVKRRIEEMWAADIRFVMTELSDHDRAQSLKAPFAGRLDLQRVGALGHSMGGLAAVRACQLDSRIAACMNQDADIAGSPFVRGSPDEPLRKPLLFFTAATANVFKGSFIHPTDEALASMRTIRAQYDADVRRVQMNQNNALAGTEAPSYRVLIDRPSFVHRSFSDLTLLAAYNEPKTSADAALDFTIATSYTRAFFDKHLKRAPDTLLERAVAPYEGVRVDTFGAR